MSIRLDGVYTSPRYTRVLYELLAERIPSQSISHKEMPSYEMHQTFVRSRPYFAWYIMIDDNNMTDNAVGSIYLTHQREIGVFVFDKFKHRGYGSSAVRLLMVRWPGKFLANINPRNEASIRFFEGMGFAHVQNTYALG